MRTLLLTTTTALIFSFPALAAQIPPTEMENLTGTVIHAPQDLKGAPTLVIFAFAHEQRDEAVRVMGLLQEAAQSNSGLGWYELPIIDAPSVAKYFIKNGMRGGTDAAFHAHIVPQFVDKDDWRKASGISDIEPFLAKVDGKGTIVKTVKLKEIQTVKDIEAL